jgi:hypothetical protein
MSTATAANETPNEGHESELKELRDRVKVLEQQLGQLLAANSSSGTVVSSTSTTAHGEDRQCFMCASNVTQQLCTNKCAPGNGRLTVERAANTENHGHACTVGMVTASGLPTCIASS